MLMGAGKPLEILVCVFLLVSLSTLPSFEQGLCSGSGEVCGRAQSRSCLLDTSLPGLDFKSS